MSVLKIDETDKNNTWNAFSFNFVFPIVSLVWSKACCIFVRTSLSFSSVSKHKLYKFLFSVDTNWTKNVKFKNKNKVKLNKCKI